MWRMGRDSNPRDVAACRFSRPVPSTTRPPIRSPRGLYHRVLAVGKRAGDIWYWIAGFATADINCSTRRDDGRLHDAVSEHCLFINEVDKKVGLAAATRHDAANNLAIDLGD